jgi:hypothetical protein
MVNFLRLPKQLLKFVLFFLSAVNQFLYSCPQEPLNSFPLDMF